MEPTTPLVFLTAVHLAMVPVTIGVVGAIKLLKFFDHSYSPIAALIVGLGLSWLIGGTVLAIVVGGLIIGLTASGLYSGTSAIKNANE